MCGCKNVSTVPMSQPAVARVVDTQCTKTKDDIINLYNRLLCYKEINPGFVVNVNLGQVISMLNTFEYCRYDVTHIEELLNSTSC